MNDYRRSGSSVLDVAGNEYGNMSSKDSESKKMTDEEEIESSTSEQNK